MNLKSIEYWRKKEFVGRELIEEILKDNNLLVSYKIGDLHFDTAIPQYLFDRLVKIDNKNCNQFIFIYHKHLELPFPLTTEALLILIVYDQRYHSNFTPLIINYLNKYSIRETIEKNN